VNKYRVVIFFLDGTLTEEIVDFSGMRGEIGVPEGMGVLEYMKALPPAERQKAEEILHGHEIKAAETCRVQPGAAEVLAGLRKRGIAVALLTRNSRTCAETVLGRHTLAMDYVATREHLPHKPHRDSILNITRHFGVLPEQTLMVGDYLYDMQTAQAAGADAVLLWNGEGERPPYAAMATHVIAKLMDLLPIVDLGARSEA
jgi:HAD superfamily hydrolase (TIGR01549 family)